MAECYNEGIGRRSRKDSRRKQKEGRSAGGFLLDLVMHLISAVLATLTLICVIIQYVSPEGLWWLPTAVLAAPVIYIAELAVTLYWIIRWRWQSAAIMLVMVAVGLFYVPRYYKSEIARHEEPKFKESRYTKVVTYNVANGNNSALVDSLGKVKPDILCVQEFLSEGWNKWESFAGDYRTTYDGKELFSCEIFVRTPNYRIIRKGEIPSLPRYSAVWADVATKSDTVRVINLHLQSTGQLSEDTQFIENHKYILDNDREDRLHSIISRLSENTCKRAVQADSVAVFVASSPYRTIVCGDLNDVPLSYTYRRTAGDMTDAFVEKGKGYAHTYDGYFSLLRIDHLFVSPEIEVCSYEVGEELEFSDHYPVIVRLKLNNKR